MTDKTPAVRAGEPGGRHLWRFVVGIPLLVLGLGLGMDACQGFSLLRGATSTSKGLGGLLGLGALYLLGEGAGEWIGSKDQVTNPLWKRVLHLLALLALCGSIGAAIWLVHAVMQ